MPMNCFHFHAVWGEIDLFSLPYASIWVQRLQVSVRTQMSSDDLNPGNRGEESIYLNYLLHVKYY